MEFSELAKNRYSCRKLSDRPVEKEKLEEILSIARLSPTAHNDQPYRIFVASGEEAVRKIKETTPCDFGASLFLLIAAEKKEGWVREFDGKNFAEVDAAIVASHVMLSMEALGLGSTWVAYFDAPKLKKLFPETADYELIALFPIGYKEKDAEPSHLHFERRPLEELVKYL